MKKFTKFVSLAAAAALLALFPNSNSLTASADGPTTYYLRYHQVKTPDDDSEAGHRQWRMQIGQWLDDDPGMELHYLNEGDNKVKDGDIIVVLEEQLTNEEKEAEADLFSDGGQHVPSLHESIKVNARLSNLTVSARGRIVITTNGVDNFYALGGDSNRSFTSISGDVTNAYVYDYSTVTFNNNVTNLRLISSEQSPGKNRPHTYVTVGGTVDYASAANIGGVYDEWWNFKAGTFVFDKNSSLMTKPENYSTSGTTPDTATPADNTQPQADNTQTAANTSSSGEYDDVPKTGDNTLAVWLFAASALCLAGSLTFRKLASRYDYK